MGGRNLRDAGQRLLGITDPFHLAHNGYRTIPRAPGKPSHPSTGAFAENRDPSEHYAAIWGS
jgi:hypothetical protein